MREIKFEFILKDECLGRYSVGKLTYTLSQLLEGISEDYIIEQATEQFAPANGLDSEFEIIAKRQYTGLKDKNGVEICEGDIVKRGFDNQLCTIEYKYGVLRTIGFSDDKYKNSYASVHEYLVDLTTQRFEFSNFNGVDTILEVIGNIYENPELLSSSETNHQG